MFNAEGSFTGVIIGVDFLEPRQKNAPDGAFDVGLHIQDENDASKSDWWRGEISERQGTGNASGKTQYEMTMATLARIGFKGDDLSKLSEQVMNSKIPCTVKASTSNNKTYYNLNIGGSFIEPIGVDEMKRRLERAKKLCGSGGSTATASSTGGGSNPFAQSSASSSNPFKK